MKIVLAICFIIVMSLTGIGQAPSNQKAILIDSILTTCQEKGIFNGAVLVADDGKVIFKKAYGVGNYKTKAPVMVEDRFYIGSMTKQFTSLLIYKLHEQGLLNIHDPISKYLSQFKEKSYKNITIYHLLTHTSGISSYNLLPNFDKGKDYSTGEVYKMIKSRAPIFEAGKKYDYSNSGYYLLGKIIEHCTKQNYGDVLHNEILEPLEMKNTAFEMTWLNNHVAKGYLMTVDGISSMPKYSLSTLYASGGMYSTVDDLYKWNKALNTNVLLVDSLKYVMFTPNVGDYASGWRVHRGYEDSLYYERHQHGGTIQGYHTYILRRIPQKQTVIVLDNFYDQEIQSIKNSIWSVLEGRGGWIPKPMVSGFLYKNIVEGQLTNILSLISEDRLGYELNYDIEEYDINIVGYRLMRVERLDEAKQVFEFNITMFPDSWNVYDSLGEVLLLQGKLDDSEEMYNKSLVLNPKNNSAIEALQEIKKLKKKK